MPSHKRKKLAGRELASFNNQALITNIERRAAPEDHVLHACLTSYRAWMESNSAKDPADRESGLTNLTHHLISTFDVTAAAIRARMVEKWSEDQDAARKVESSVTNSLRRSAGTNYQSLVSYAIAHTLEEAHSDWYVVHPIPPSFGNSLSIRFGSATATPATAVEPLLSGSAESEPGAEQVADDSDYEDSDDEEASVVVKPDLDILIRSASWVASDDAPEPVLVLSVKTSLADRAGSAARWKTYFDLVTRPCEHACEDSCAYRRLGITLAEAPNVAITHGIVTANIYKMNSDPYFAQYGELRSNQAKANTFMFDLRFTTRDDTEDAMSPGWSSLATLPNWLAHPSTLAAQGTNPADAMVSER